MAIWYILWPLGIFPPIWYLVPRKIWQPWSLPPPSFFLYISAQKLKKRSKILHALLQQSFPELSLLHRCCHFKLNCAKQKQTFFRVQPLNSTLLIIVFVNLAKVLHSAIP
jgi:hypothetical protein